jgi:hypothetical protein
MFRQTAMETRGEGGLTKSLTMGWPHKCVYESKGFNRVG